MTAPGAMPPSGAYVFGSDYGNMTEETAKQLATGQGRSSYNAAAGEWGAQLDDLADIAATLNDGQLGLNDRVDYLEAVEGYCALFMDKNWNVGGGKFTELPFNTQLGPNKGAELFTAGGKFGIKLLKKGLWRADAHVTFKQPPSEWFSDGTVAASVYCSVMRISDNSVFTEHQYDIAITPRGSETAAFSHTFVVPDDGLFYVRAGVAHPKPSAWIFGGTLRSALTVNKWDTGVENVLVLPTAPDGGSL